VLGLYHPHHDGPSPDGCGRSLPAIRRRPHCRIFSRTGCKPGVVLLALTYLAPFDPQVSRWTSECGCTPVATRKRRKHQLRLWEGGGPTRSAYRHLTTNSVTCEFSQPPHLAHQLSITEALGGDGEGVRT
jgi:hypothetical protein